mgnify:CR=1 FL=1
MGASRPRDRAPTRLQQPAAWVDAALRVAAADTPGFAWLDGGDDGRSFLGLHADRELEGDDPALLDVVDRAWRADRSRLWIGAITYDFAADLAAARAPRPRALPGLLLRRYACALERSRDGVVRVHGDDALPTWFAEVQPTDVAGPWPLTPPVAVWSPAHYRAQVLAAKQHLFAGDSYQVNLAQRFVAHFDAGGVVDVVVEPRGATLGSRLGEHRYAVPAEVDWAWGVACKPPGPFPLPGDEPDPYQAVVDTDAVQALRNEAKERGWTDDELGPIWRTRGEVCAALARLDWPWLEGDTKSYKWRKRVEALVDALD